jgi:uncharacterized protein YoxC
MKKWMLIIFACLLFGGCGITNQDIDNVVSGIDQVSQSVDVYQSQVKELMDQIEEDGLLTPELKEKLDKLGTETDDVQSYMNAVIKAFQEADTGSDVVATLIAKLQAANQASAGFNPYWPYVSAVLGAFSIFFGKKAKDNGDTAAEAQAKYKAHKQGVEKTMKELSASEDTKVKAVETQLYSNIGEARKNVGI